jgi:hypothetical protein
MSYVLTNTTLELLKNFANINPQAVFKAGSAQRTANVSRNFIADIELSEPLPVDCNIYELNRLLGIIDSCKGEELPTIAFGPKALVVEHEHGAVTIPYAHEAVVTPPPTQKFHLAKTVASFDLSQVMWNKIKKTASALQTTSIQIIVTKAGTLTLKLINDKNKGDGSSGEATYNMPNTKVMEPIDNTWGIIFDSLELLPGDYAVELGEISTPANTKSIFGMFFHLNDPNKKVSYLTSGVLVSKAR